MYFSEKRGGPLRTSIHPELEKRHGAPDRTGPLTVGPPEPHQYSILVSSITFESMLRRERDLLESWVHVVTNNRIGAKTFLVLLDSGYPASHFLLPPPDLIRSKFACSVSVSKVSGPLRVLAEVATIFLRKTECLVLYSPKLNLVATLHGKQQYTSVLVTNYFLPSNEIVQPDAPLKIPISDVRILSKLSHPTFLRISNTFAPKLSKDTQCLTDLRMHISLLTGVDIGSPLDENGLVSAASLNALAIDDLREVARINGVPTTKGAKPKAKNTLVREILVVGNPTQILQEPTSQPQEPTRWRRPG